MSVITLDGITLPGDFSWADEFEWVSVDRTMEYSLTGKAIYKQFPKVSGRPITLVAGNEFKGPIWIARSIVKELYAKAALLSHTMTLVLADSRTFSVVFDDKSIEAKAVYHVAPNLDTDPYYITLYLRTV
jgi:hypothetical protein